MKHTEITLNGRNHVVVVDYSVKGDKVQVLQVLNGREELKDIDRIKVYGTDMTIEQQLEKEIL